MLCCCIFDLALFAMSYGYCLYQASVCQKKSTQDQRRWFFVWTFIGALALIEKILFFLPLIPGYCIFKSLFIVWLYHEKYNVNTSYKHTAKENDFLSDQGAQYLYHKFLEPFDAQLDLLLKPLASLGLDHK